MKAERCRFGGETLSFLVVSVAFSAVLYNYFASEPLLLQAGNAVSTEAGPSPFRVADPARLPTVRYHREGDRASPFKPAQSSVKEQVEVAGKPIGLTSTPSQGPIPPSQSAKPGSEQVPETRPIADKPVRLKSASDLTFVGTVFVGDKSCALLHPSDSATRLRVKPGDVIPEYGCTVTHIGRQSIHLAGREQQRVVIRDGK